jgi:hypothetical protein
MGLPYSMSPSPNCRAVQVLENYHDGNDYLIRNHETKTAWSFQVFKITDRSNPVYVSSITETPAGLLTYAHKGWWDRTTGFYFGSAGEPGFRPRGHLTIWDLSNPSKPKYVSHHWIRGQKLTEPDPGGRGLCLHHPVVDMANKKAYLSYHRGGNVAVVDISNISNPTTILDFTIEPPFKGPHTSMPLYGVKCPNFTPGFGDIRDFIVIANEASDADYQGQEVRTLLMMLDVTAWNNPITVDSFKVPDGDFCVRILDLSDPYDMKEVGYYIPKTTATTIPRRKTVIQTNDVDIDYRGLIYITDRAGTGLHIIEYLGKK